MIPVFVAYKQGFYHSWIQTAACDPRNKFLPAETGIHQNSPLFSVKEDCIPLAPASKYSYSQAHKIFSRCFESFYGSL